MVLLISDLVVLVVVTVLRIFLFFRLNEGSLCCMTFLLEQAGSVAEVKNGRPNKRYEYKERTPKHFTFFGDRCVKGIQHRDDD